MTITYREYRDEISDIAEDLYKEAMEEHPEDEDDRNSYVYDSLHERIDGHQWVIYYRYNNKVLEHSSNPDAYQHVYDNESLGELLKERGFDKLKTTMAYFAMFDDVYDSITQLDQGV
tara:strand:+ start:206 stop:556 length:351 start_codon:yes stop_codon:yes gene_type:complete